MKHEIIMQQIKDYISTSILRGKDIGLDAQTPLLEWGVINSIEIVRLFSFVREHFQIDISTKHMVARNFSNIEAIANMVETKLAEAGNQPEK
jgi:acyl carrier protein